MARHERRDLIEEDTAGPFCPKWGGEAPLDLRGAGQGRTGSLTGAKDMRILRDLFGRYKEIWISLILAVLFLVFDMTTTRAILQMHLLRSKRLFRLEDYILEAIVVLLMLLGGVLAYRERKRRQQAETKILKAILTTLNHDLTDPLSVILANISLLLKSENRLVAENKSVIHKMETASSKIRALIFQLSQVDRIDLRAFLEANKR